MPKLSKEVGEIKKKCLLVQQGSGMFYAFVINSKELRNIAYVSHRDKANASGYQRVLSGARLKEVGAYIKKATAIFPNSIIINFGQDKADVNVDPGDHTGTITIRNEKEAAWVIDGQHRLWGFQYSDGKEFDVLVSAFIGLPLSGQATTFTTINSEQKGVNSSLIYDLIELTKDATWQDQRLHELTKALNEDVDSPWKDQIKMVGTGKGLITQAGMIRELSKILNDEIFKDSLQSDQLKLLKDYFTAVQELFPEAWLNRKYLLCKTLGVGALILIMPRILIACLMDSDFSKNNMKKLLKVLQQVKISTQTGSETINWSSTQLGGLGGVRGQVQLAKILENSLPKLRKSP